MSPVTALCARANFLRIAPRFGGVRVTGPDPVSTWGVCVQIAGGEYDLAGLRPLPGQRVIDIRRQYRPLFALGRPSRRHGRDCL